LATIASRFPLVIFTPCMVVIRHDLPADATKAQLRMRSYKGRFGERFVLTGARARARWFNHIIHIRVFGLYRYKS
jgi:hypothetical protein